MSTQTKYQISRILTFASLPAAAYVLGKMMPAGLSGDAATVKRLAIVFFIIVLVGISSTIVYYYSRAALNIDANGTSGTDVLSAAADDIRREKALTLAAKTRMQDKSASSRPPKP